MRILLDKVYQLAGALSGLSIVLICLVILARVMGRWFGIVVPSSDDVAGYLLATASFLALAYAFRSGTHIRVSLFVSRLSAMQVLWVERGVLTLAAALVSYLAYQLCAMVLESWQFAEVTSGYLPMPLWAVQLPMATGAAIFAISVIDSALCSWLFATPIPKSEEELLAESTPAQLSWPSQPALQEDHHE